MVTYFGESVLIKIEIRALNDNNWQRSKQTLIKSEFGQVEATVGGGALTRSLCGPGQTRPRRIHLCSPFPPSRADVVGTARSSSPGKRAPFPSRSNSGSEEKEESCAFRRM